MDKPQSGNECIDDLLVTWQAETGQELHPMATARMGYDFLKMFTCSDLACVIRHLKRENKAMGGPEFKIRAHRVLGDTEWFASMLGEARAKERNLIHKTPKDKVLANFRGYSEPKPDKPIMTFAEAFKKLSAGLDKQHLETSQASGSAHPLEVDKTKQQDSSNYAAPQRPSPTSKLPPGRMGCSTDKDV